MGCAALGIVGAGFLKAELAVDGEADLRGVAVLLAIVFPPADRAKFKSCRGIESFRSAAGATEAHFDRWIHTGMDGKSGGWDYGKQFVVRSS
jgi:hypothetical protein